MLTASGQSSGNNNLCEEGNGGMRSMVIDAAGPNFDWTNEDGHFGSNFQEPNPDAKQFYNLLKDADEPLWEGCKKHSKLSAVSQLLNLKSEFNLPQACYDRLMSTIKDMMPEDEKLPSNLYETKKMVAGLGLGYEKIDACVNNCILYYKENSRRSRCTICGHDRYKPRNLNSRKDVPYKVLRYLPLIPRLQRLYMSNETAKQMTWHYTNQCVDGSMAHPSNSKAWKHFDETHPSFSSEPRNIRLGFCTDGFCPFGNSGTPYSCWPVMLVVYNLPPGMCMKEPYIFLNMVIPGPKSPGKNLDVFLRPLIDELKVLWGEGVQTYDVSSKVNFQMRATLLWTINDFPAFGMVSGWSTHGRLSCPYCMERTKSFRLGNGHKNSWFDCHRQFLPRQHVYRKQRDKFLKGRIEVDAPPRYLSSEEIWERVSRLPNPTYDKFGCPKSLPGFGVAHNWFKKSIFWELPYWRSNLIRHNLDVMHIEKNVFENIFNTLLDVKGKSKDNGNARKDIELHCDRPELHMFVDQNSKPWKPKASYTLGKQHVQDLCDWIKELKLPDGYASNIARCVNEKESKFYGMKSHDCHIFMQRLLPIVFRDILPKPVWEAISEVSVFFRDLCSTVLRVDHVEQLEKNIVEIICKLEKIFPPAFFDCMEHLPIHLAYEAKIGGPVQYRWMYPFERFLHRLKKKVKNWARVEGSIVEAYIIEEVSTFCSLYFDPNVEKRLNRVPRNDDGGEVDPGGRLSIFTSPGREFGPKQPIRLFEEIELSAAHIYILLNYDELIPFVNQFDEEMMRQNQMLTDNALSLLRDKNFPSWLNAYVMDQQNNVDERIKFIAQGPSRWVKNYKGYFVNGYKFHTMDYGRHKATANSGVCVLGSSWNENEMDYYGLLEEVIELEYYGTTNKIVLFKCEWFDISHRGVKAYPRFGLVEVNSTRKLNTNDPFILASQAQQVYYTRFPSGNRERRDWRAVCKIKARSRTDIPLIVGQAEDNQEIIDGAFQEDQILAPHEVSLTVDLDQVHILLDTSGGAVEVDPEEIRFEELHAREEHGEEVEEEEGDDDDEEEDEKENRFDDFASSDDNSD